MKTENSNVVMVNNSNQSQSVSKSVNCSFVRLVEGRYGIKFQPKIWICEERSFGYGKMPEWYEYQYRSVPNYCLYGVKNAEINMCDLNFESLKELYSITKTMNHSNKNKINISEWEYKNKMKFLVPVVFIRYKRKTLAFRLDNVIISEMFKDAEMIKSGQSKKGGCSEMAKSQLRHIEYLESAFSNFESETNEVTWHEILLEKEILGKSDMLHSEYLYWKSSNLKLQTI